MELKNGAEDDQCVVFKVSRKSAVCEVKNGLRQSLDPLQTNLTLSVLQNLFREETQKNLSEFAQALGYPSVPLMLNSDEFSDVITYEFDDNRMERVYKSVPEKTTPTVSLPVSNNPHFECRSDPYSNVLYNDKVLEGKQRLLYAIAKAGGEKKNVSLIDVQKLYHSDNRVLLNKAELRRYFPNSHIKEVFDIYMKDEVDVSDWGLNGICLKKPFSEILKEIKRTHEKKPNTSHASANSEAEISVQDFMSNKLNQRNGIDAYAPLRNIQNEASGDDMNNLNGLSKFSLTDNVEKAYALSNLDGLNKSSMAPFVKKSVSKPQKGTSNPSNSNLSNNAEIDLLFSTKESNLNSSHLQRKNSLNLMDLELENGNKNPSRDQLFESYNNFYDEKKDDNLSKNSNNFGGLKNILRPAGRAVGNVEELNRILATSSSRYSSFNRNSNVSNLSLSANQPKIEKTEVKYTKRCDGIFTDDETSSEDELDQGNQQIQFEQKQEEKKFFSPDKQNGGCKIYVPNDDFSASVHSDLAAFENKNQRNCHAEKYYRLAKLRQEEIEGRRMAHSIAQFQKLNPNGEFMENFANNFENDDDLGKKFAPQRDEDHHSNSVNNTKENGLNDFSSCIDDDFLMEYPTKIQNIPHADWNGSSKFVNNFSQFDGNLEGENVSNDVYILCATISVIVMNRKPSVTLTDLETVLESIYGKKLVSGKDFHESSLEAFIEKYCCNVYPIKVPRNLLYVWQEQGDAEFKEIMTKVGKICAQKTPAL